MSDCGGGLPLIVGMLRMGSRRNGWSRVLRWPRSWGPRPPPRASCGRRSLWSGHSQDRASLGLAGAAVAGLCWVEVPADMRACPGLCSVDRRYCGWSRGPAPTFPGAGAREAAAPGTRPCAPSGSLVWPLL